MSLFGLFGGGDSGFNDARANVDKNRALYNDIDLPKYAEYIPELYDNESYTAKLLSEDPVLKSKQLEALSKFQDLGSEGLSDADQAGFAQAKAEGNQLAKARTDAAIQDAQARGVAGSGMEFALREAANQAGAQRAQEAANAQAAARANQRGQYLQAYANQLGGMRDQDYRANASNTNVLNQYNQMNTQQRNATNQGNVDQRNNAFMYNQGLLDKNYQNQMKKADSMAGLNNQQTQIDLAQQAADQQRKRAQMGLIGAGAGAALGGGTGAMVGSQVGSMLY